MKSLIVALRGKGVYKFLDRITSILRRYGATASKYEHTLAQFVQTLDQFDCKATFPTTVVALKRHPEAFRKHQDHGIEFAVHGYRHVDHSLLSLEEHLAELEVAKRTISQCGVRADGFRCPYLRWNPATLQALEKLAFSYDSSQALFWPVPADSETPAYLKAIEFYRAFSANEYPSLPYLKDGLVRIPYALPDDESLVERLALSSPEQTNALWLQILQNTYELGELFTIGLHPERFFLCRAPLEAVLGEARRRTPGVWMARLDEIATWWRARVATRIEIQDTTEGIRLLIAGPLGLVVLARQVEIDVSSAPWADGYFQVDTTTFNLRAPVRPFVGVSPHASPQMVDYLWQQGYIVEISPDGQRHAVYIDWKEFGSEHMRPLLDQIARADRPLVRLGRWPRGMRSALSVTGDIDALTIWDYGLRMFGR